jgi:hypothetical protein
MSRKPSPEVTADLPAGDAAPAAHPLPSEGGSYVIEAGELHQVDAPTAPDNPNAPAPAAAPETEA